VCYGAQAVHHRHAATIGHAATAANVVVHSTNAALCALRIAKKVPHGGDHARAAGEEGVPHPPPFGTGFSRVGLYHTPGRAPGVAAAGDPSKGRDVFNEKLSKEEIALAVTANPTLGQAAVIRTTMGDIHVKLFPDEAPKAVENFSTHSRNGYYNGHLVHRVIKGFMLQTGDPGGDGRGGESIWGQDFDDEFHKTLKFDRPFILAMANAGPNTNGSQFFITTVPTPHLDGKHTIFGRVTKGMDVVQAIEKVKTDRGDRPVKDVKLINVEISAA